jgi:hypothetical protein
MQADYRRQNWRLSMFPLNIIHLLRAGGVTDWLGLCKAIGVPPQSSPAYRLHGMLEPLVNIGVIERGSREGDNFSLSLTPKWYSFQHALGFSLTELAKFPPDKAIYVQPFYPRPIIPQSETIPDVFVLMPFQRGMQNVYEQGLKKAAQDLQLSIARADDLKSLEHIMDDVWKSIYAARFIIADCTNGNPNVFYEMGIAHTLGKPMLLITQTPATIPFDIRQVRFIGYKKSSKGLQELTTNVRAFLLEMTQKETE